ncbi:hypothetical protein UlMin_041147 [Ulmus minor]
MKKAFWWSGLKKDVASYVAKCLVCQKIKAEHQRPAGVLQPIEIPEWKWEQISMDFVVAHFLPIKVTYSLEQLADLYVKEIVRLHGVPVSIISDRDSRFTSAFWKSVQRAMGTKLKFSTAFHPQTDGQTERTIQTLEDMLRACVMEFKGGWSKYLPLIEFSYNNSYQVTIGMAPYEALYGRRCRSPAHWHETGENQIAAPDFIESTTEAGKLSPRYIGPFEILERIGKVAYKLALPSELASVHNVFHVSMLRKYVSDPSHVLESEPIEVREDLTYQEQPVQILDRKDKALRNKVIPLVKVLWRNHKAEEATWEREDEMRAKYQRVSKREGCIGAKESKPPREKEEEEARELDFSCDSNSQRRSSVSLDHP